MQVHLFGGQVSDPFSQPGALYALTVLSLWILILAGVIDYETHIAPSLIHGHEMIYGFGVAAIAGFNFNGHAELDQYGAFIRQTPDRPFWPLALWQTVLFGRESFFPIAFSPPLIFCSFRFCQSTPQEYSLEQVTNETLCYPVSL
ncbi:NnrS family protein [Kiloniella litopenaei]|uniref:NnrS family protein n=1 Tax=Kiloniella litopenaei TaxID=1549748 RepID=UPI003BA9D46A